MLYISINNVPNNWSITGCNKKRLLSERDNAYADGFENPIYQQDDAEQSLFDEEEIYWSFSQIRGGNNGFRLETDTVQEGAFSLRFSADPTKNGDASKSSIAKQNLIFWEGETIHVSAWYYLAGEQSLDYIFLMDIEERTAIGAGPGMRVTLTDGALALERNKMGLSTIYQPDGASIAFPRNQWVKITLEAELSRKKKGWVKLYQNDVLMLEKIDTRTLPKDRLYFTQGTKGALESIELGITANSADNSAVLYLDNIDARVLE